MELQTKFIEGTNEQYSIREDGVVFRNYIFYSNHSTNKIHKVFKKLQIKKTTSPSYSIRTGTKTSIISKAKTLLKHFGFKYCKKCNQKIYINENCNDLLCKECKIESVKKHYKQSNERQKNIDKKLQHAYYLNYKNNNFENYKATRKKAADKRTKTITKGYVADILEISLTELSDSLYQEKKKLLLFKREIAEKHNIHISSLK
jgi:hypothetical protein